jgi:transposase
MTTAAAARKIETEITERPLRRRFTKEYKLRILEEADRCTKAGETGALLRREGLYSSHLTNWRGQRHEGTLKALERKRGPKPKRRPEQAEVEKLRRENERLRERLRKAEKIIDVQKKLSEVLGLDSDDDEETT